MFHPSDTFDVVIIGAGSAGSACAYHFADRGFRVALVEARPLDSAGARWVNSVPTWCFEEAGIPLPEAPELRHSGEGFTLTDPSGEARVTADTGSGLHVDMRLLCERLQNMAKALEAEIVDRARVTDASTIGDGEHTRLRTITLTIRPEGKKQTTRQLTADLFVDASGLGGSIKQYAPTLDRDCPVVPVQHICNAAQQVREIEDIAGAEAWLNENRFEPKRNLCKVGLEGGFSTLNIYVDLESREIDILTGATALQDYATGGQMITRFVQEQPWIGKQIFGGGGLIPMRRPYDRLAANGVALLGNAACQVYPSHASGVGFGLMAAKILVDATAPYRDLGGEQALWAYQSAFQRRHGGVLGACEVFRRLSQTLQPEDMKALISCGVINPRSASAALNHGMAQLTFKELPSLADFTRKHSKLAWNIGRRLAVMPIVEQLYKRYPQVIDEGRLRRWSTQVALAFGDKREIGGEGVKLPKPLAKLVE